MDEELYRGIMKEAESDALRMNQALSRMLLALWKHSREEVRACTRAARRLFAASFLTAFAAALFLGLGLQTRSEVYALRAEIYAAIQAEQAERE